MCLSLLFFTAALITHGAEGKTIPGVGFNNTLTLGYLLSWSHEWAAGPYIGSSIILAIEEIEKRQLLPGYNIDWILRDTWCQVCVLLPTFFSLTQQQRIPDMRLRKAAAQDK